MAKPPERRRAGTDTIFLRGREIPIELTEVDNYTLQFYPENPRIYSLLWGDTAVAPTQQEIFDALSRSEHVRDELLPSIKLHGGLIEPLLVKGNVVLEGNSRLAAYRLLSQTGDPKWKYVHIRRLPNSIDESDVFALLGEYHIVGKKDWVPYEQAGYLWRRRKKHNVSEVELTKQVGLRLARVRHYIKVYQFMIDHNDRTATRWSFYDELLKGRKYKEVIESYPDFFDFIADKVNSGEIPRAVDVRDSLPLIVKAGGNTLKKFMKGKMDFDEAVNDAKRRGAGDYNMRMLKDFRQWIAEAYLDQEFQQSSDIEKRAIRFELDRIGRRIRGLLASVQA
jgi:hypothetical protein